ncbi:DUF881 domain-containing protein [Janibacter cremeus]|uniref:DUF881 domain-containing protein n=1 Tax=Janibacter cremeus TaxID=1285192 RepID=UPI0023F7CB61|nr:DUF881 domain-containing protein [Janibacter cremeus]WEV79067.1 DUF881 domain-containing protein [Janibacter cremeus]
MSDDMDDSSAQGPGATGEEPGTKPAAGSTRSSRASWRRIYLMARPRLTRANVFALLLASLLGFALATQVRQTQAEGLEDLRQDELVRILDDVTQNGSRLDEEIAELEEARDRLANSEGNSPEALAAARERAETLGILAGTERATGPGITLRIEDHGGEVDAATLLDTVQELRDAGAEAMQVGDARIIASTWFRDSEEGVVVDGRTLEPPYTFVVIGDPQTMSSAMEIPGGVSESIRSKGGEVTVHEFSSINVEALHSNSSPRYAQPHPEPTDGLQ